MIRFLRLFRDRHRTAVFPQSSATPQQLLAFAVFAVGFAARPIGSVVLGIVGDRIGRCALLTLFIDQGSCWQTR